MAVFAIYKQSLQSLYFQVMNNKKMADSAAVDKNESKNRGWPKGKRRYPKGAGAPKQPLSGYVHFLNERRETVRAENPDITFAELSKKLAAEWSKLGDEEKLKYNEFAKKDKDRCVQRVIFLI